MKDEGLRLSDESVSFRLSRRSRQWANPATDRDEIIQDFTKIRRQVSRIQDTRIQEKETISR